MSVAPGFTEDDRKYYAVPVQFTFSGVFKIKASSPKEALLRSKDHCGMTVGDISSSLPEKDVDWEFPIHPDRLTGKPYTL